MIAHAQERLASRLATAYDLPLVTATAAIHKAEALLHGIHEPAIAFERDRANILLISGGEIVATLPLDGILPAIAPACDTLDPYGDREDVLMAMHRDTPAG